ncbi:MAG: SufD family Fe-S cluster assembly protein, partial [Gemmatimonadetes bacterium]|nr:SufD family Fe-S cluster assembly protein [Gemmatimonadota bacterium]
PSPAAGTVDPADIEPHALEGAAALLVFADGRFVPGLSHTDRLPAGVRAVSIAAALQTGGADFPVSGIDLLVGGGASGFAALNTAFVEDGAALRIPARTEVEGPVQILYVSTGAGDGPVASFPRTLVVAGEESRAAVVESFVGGGTVSGGPARLTNAVCEIRLERGSRLEHCTLQQEGDEASHVGLLHVTESGGSRFTSTSAALSGRFLRRDAITVLAGEGVESTLNGLYLGAGSEHIDNFTTVEHTRPPASSAAGSTCIEAPRTPTPTSRTRICCCRTRPTSPRSRSSRSTPTTCAAATARPRGSWTRTPCSTCSRAPFPGPRRCACSPVPSAGRWSTASARRSCGRTCANWPTPRWNA